MKNRNNFINRVLIINLSLFIAVTSSAEFTQSQAEEFARNCIARLGMRVTGRLTTNSRTTSSPLMGVVWEVSAPGAGGDIKLKFSNSQGRFFMLTAPSEPLAVARSNPRYVSNEAMWQRAEGALGLVQWPLSNRVRGSLSKREDGMGEITCKFFQSVDGVSNKGVGNYALVTFSRVTGNVRRVEVTNGFVYGPRIVHCSVSEAISRAARVLNEPVANLSARTSFSPTNGKYNSASGLRYNRTLEIRYTHQVFSTVTRRTVYVDATTGEIVGGMGKVG